MVSALHLCHMRQGGTGAMRETSTDHRQTIVVSRRKSTVPRRRSRGETLVVTTPLEVIARLEQDREHVGTVVLAGSFAANRELVTFLTESYPALQILSARSDEEPDTYLPLFA